MTLLLYIAFGVLGCILYQAVMARDFRGHRGFWPWQDTSANMTVGFYLYSSVTRVIIAAVVVGAFANMGQISGIWAAMLVGIGADQIFKTAGSKIIKEAQNEIG